MKNFVVRAVVGVVFVAVMVGAIVWRADSMILLFAIITGLSIWEFCGLVNQIDDVQTNAVLEAVRNGIFILTGTAFAVPQYFRILSSLSICPHARYPKHPADNCP